MTEVKVQLTSHRRLSVPRFIIMVLIINNNPKMAIKEEHASEFSLCTCKTFKWLLYVNEKQKNEHHEFITYPFNYRAHKNI